jgi:hypothetical protein
MTFLLWTLLTLAAAAVTVTVHAVTTAKEGVEDETGFHFVNRAAQGSETAAGLNALRPSHT